MRILMTGATGYLGGHLRAAFARAGHDVVGLGSADADLRRDDALERFTDRYDQIWHLAAWTQAGDFCIFHPGEQWVINQRINTNVLDWWSRRQPQAKLISIGTSCSYAPGEALVEDNYLRGEPVPELYAYAMTKRMLYVGQRALSKQYGLRYLTLIPSTLFGSGYHTAGKQLHFIFDLIRKIARAKVFGEPAVLWGDGGQKRELIYVDDFVRAALELSVSVDNELVNVGSGREFSIRWYADVIAKRLQCPPDRIQYDTSKYVGVRSKQLSTQKLQALLPAFRFTPLEDALGRVVDEYAAALARDGAVQH